MTDVFVGLALTILAALWIARACYIEAQRKVDVLLAADEAAEAAARLVMCEANKDLYDRMGATR